jgi:hypothetical protein
MKAEDIVGLLIPVTFLLCAVPALANVRTPRWLGYIIQRPSRTGCTEPMNSRLTSDTSKTRRPPLLPLPAFFMKNSRLERQSAAA